MTTANQMAPLDIDRWHPIGRSDDATLRHVFQAKLLGRELAVWRADDGYLNVWENRCLHRGVRLSIGMNEGSELRCMYHGWRYASRTGGCTYIPAHPADAPARAIRNRTFPVHEQFGLVWTTLNPESASPEFGELELAAPFALRSLPFNASAAVSMQVLREYCVRADGRSTVDTAAPLPRIAFDGYALRLASTAEGPEGGPEGGVVLFVQPCDSGESVVHGVLDREPARGTEIDVWRYHAQELERLRAVAETLAEALPRPAPLEPALERIEPSETDVPMPRARSESELRVVVHRKWETAEGVAAFELGSLAGALPTACPGAHIDVHLPNGLVRQYSLTNPAGDQDSFVIAVKREPDSRGGSSCMHDTVREGDVLAISAPRHNFVLRRDAVRTVLIAGGIGITPLLAMAETLKADRLMFTLEYFAQSEQHLAFKDRLSSLGDCFAPHVGLSPDETGDALRSILACYQPAMHVYICGPGPMLDAARAVAIETGWPEAAVHFEYFKNSGDIDLSSSFTVHLARSGMTLEVQSGETILDVLRHNGVAIASSCEQGACGTCVLSVVDGIPDHQDVYLKPSEREAGDRIATCVSRSMSDAITLDI